MTPVAVGAGQHTKPPFVRICQEHPSCLRFDFRALSLSKDDLLTCCCCCCCCCCWRPPSSTNQLAAQAETTICKCTSAAPKMCVALLAATSAPACVDASCSLPLEVLCWLAERGTASCSTDASGQMSVGLPVRPKNPGQGAHLPRCQWTGCRTQSDRSEPAPSDTAGRVWHSLSFHQLWSSRPQSGARACGGPRCSPCAQ